MGSIDNTAKRARPVCSEALLFICQLLLVRNGILINNLNILQIKLMFMPMQCSAVNLSCEIKIDVFGRNVSVLVLYNDGLCIQSLVAVRYTFIFIILHVPSIYMIIRNINSSIKILKILAKNRLFISTVNLDITIAGTLIVQT